jgi:simple sugar transport system ATP-binding protein
LGENGAGKTTLVRVLYGLVQPDAGVVEIDSKPFRVRSPRHALELGIGLVHQHFMGVPQLSVAENLTLGDPGSWLLPRRVLRAQARQRLAEFGLEIDVDARAADLSVAQQQRLEIARCLARGVELLILDEPTAVLAPSEIRALLDLIAELRDAGRTVVFISHRLEEITAVCDRVTVLRHGQTVATRELRGLRAAELGRMMVGEEPPPPGRPVGRALGAVALRVRGLSAGLLDDLDFDVRAGEIFAIGGIDGNGQDELEAVLAGVREPEAGDVDVVRGPLALLPGDRQRTGLVLDLSLEENLILIDAAQAAGWPSFRAGLVRRRAVRAEAESAIESLAIRGSPGQPARTLSGGNQQKLCVARALRRWPAVLVAVNPTRGLDLGSSAAVRERLRTEARRGTAVLLISTDLDELLEVGDRIAVLHRGELLPVEAQLRTRERIGELMLGRGAA